MAPAEHGRFDDGMTNAGEYAELSTGAALAAARMALGRTLEDIATETRVPKRHLRALEADEHDALPALPYAQGFVRSFARAVKLDPEAMANRFRAETSKQPHVPTPSTLEPLDERRLPAGGLVAATVIGLVILVAGLSAWGAGAFDPALPEVAGEAVVAESAPDRAVVDRAVVTGPAEAAFGTNLPAAGGDAVVLTATADVWVRIYDPASKIVAMSGVMVPGQRFEVPTDPAGLMLWTGRAGALEVRVGGSLLPPLGALEQTLRAVSLDPKDLRGRPAAPAAAGVVTPTREQSGV